MLVAIAQNGRCRVWLLCICLYLAASLRRGSTEDRRGLGGGGGALVRGEEQGAWVPGSQGDFQGPIAPPAPPYTPLPPDAPPWPPSMPQMPSPPPSPPPMFCPRLPPYPGLASVQVVPCDAEFPVPDVCGLGILNGTRITFGPGDVFAIEYSNLNSSRAALSRLVLSAERLAFSSAWVREDWAAPAAMVLLASGLCVGPGTAALSTCLHNLYHGVPAYRACPGCFGLGVVRELGVPAEATGAWEGEAASTGDTSYYRTQLPLDAPSLFYFVASVGSHRVAVNYARVARLLYMPGTAAAFMPPSNFSYINVTRTNATGNSTGGDGGSGGGGGGSVNATEPLADGGQGSNASNAVAPLPASAELAVPSPQQPVSKLTSGAVVSRCGRLAELLLAAVAVVLVAFE